MSWSLQRALRVFGAAAALGSAAGPAWAQTAPFTRYFAEGASSSFFSTRFAFANAEDLPARVSIEILTDDGVRLAHALTVPARARRGLAASAIPGLGAGAFSAIVSADRPIAVERHMAWDGTAHGTHAEIGSVGPSTTWYLAEGSTAGDFTLFYLLFNPAPQPTTATIRFVRPEGRPDVVRTYALPAASRTTIPVASQDPELASTDVSAVITTPDPIVVERAMYRDRPGQLFAAGLAGAGVARPATTWYFAEGATGPFFDMFLLVLTPAGEATMDVRYVTDGGIVDRTYRIPGGSRVTIPVDRDVPNGTPACIIRSSAPIVVERTMWWPDAVGTAPRWSEAHVSSGLPQLASRWLLADGEVGDGGRETFLLVLGVFQRVFQFDVTLLFDDGPPVARTFGGVEIARRTISIRDAFPEAVGRRFAILVEDDGLGGLAVERSTYADARGEVWASGTSVPASYQPAGTAVVVPGQANLYLARMSDGTTADAGDVAPQNSPPASLRLRPEFQAGEPVQYVLVSASGSVSAGACELAPCPVTGPDGDVASAAVRHRIGPEHGKGDVMAPVNALIGVFLTPAPPEFITVVPPPLAFETPASRDYLTIEPRVHQPFFIGDGLTSAGARQRIVVPAGATGLFLGVMDRCCWHDNTGAFTVQLSLVDLVYR